MEIHVETSEQDYYLFTKLIYFKRYWWRKALLILGVALMLIKQLCDQKTSITQIFMWLLVVLGIFAFLYFMPYLRSLKALKKQFSQKEPSFPFTKTFILQEDGIIVRSENHNSSWHWQNIRSINIVEDFVFIRLKRKGYYILPQKCFVSNKQLLDFLEAVNKGIVIGKYNALHNNTHQKKPKHLYPWGLIGLIPLVGGIVDAILIYKGVYKYKDKALVAIGSIALVFSITCFVLFYTGSYKPIFNKGFADITQTQVNSLVKNIEFYKLQNGSYPDSLQQIDTKGSFTSIYDDMHTSLFDKKEIPYQYHKKRNRYLLFSVGVDGIPNTKDDIYPTLSNPDTSKLGFIRKK